MGGGGTTGKFTKAAPFEFEGIEVGRETNVPNGYSTRVWVGNGNREGFIEPEDARAVHAFIEAEGTPKQLTEPTKLGYVGTILSKYGSTHHVYRYYSDSYGYAYSLVGLAAGGEARGLSWGVVLQAGKFTAVAS